MNPLSPPIQEAHVYFSEVVLTEFSGQALEARDQTDTLRSDGMDQLVKSALAAPVTQKPGSAHDLEGEQVGLLRELRHYQGSVRLSLRGPSNPPANPLCIVVDVADPCLSLDALHASNAYPGQLGYVRQAVARPTQHLNLVTLQQVDHPLPRRFLQRVWTPAPDRKSVV